MLSDYAVNVFDFGIVSPTLVVRWTAFSWDFCCCSWLIKLTTIFLNAMIGSDVDSIKIWKLMKKNFEKTNQDSNQLRFCWLFWERKVWNKENCLNSRLKKQIFGQMFPQKTCIQVQLFWILHYANWVLLLLCYSPQDSFTK